MKKNSNKWFILDSTEEINFYKKLKKILKYILAIKYNITYKTINLKEIDDKKYKVAICAIFKNEAKYLKEWIEFNSLIGIEHFYLYNNNSDDNYLEILKPYIDKGIVTLNQWTKQHAQMECYNDCINKYKNETRWLGFIDIDEFIVPKNTNNIYDFLKEFENRYGSVKIYWKMFGTSGLLDRDLSTLVTEKFTVSWPKYYSVGKCFYNTRFDFDFKNKKNGNLHHMFWSKYKGMLLPPVNIFKKVCLNDLDITKIDKDFPIQINHYFTKSYNEYLMKKNKGDVFFETNPHDEEYFYLHEQENIDVDFSAYKYLIKLKIQMKKGDQL